jgi:hypothetical protein
MSEEAIPAGESQEVADAGAVEAPQEAAPAAQAPAEPLSFLDSLPEDLRQEPSLKLVNDVESLAKSYVHAQRMIGADKVALPGKSATADEWREVYKKLGAPDDPNAYDVQIGENVLTENEIGNFKNAAFEAGLNPQQAERVAQFINESVSSALEGREQQVEAARYESEQALRKEWGQAFDQQVQLAYKAANTFLGNTELLDTVELADGRLLGDHPEVVKMFSKLAKEIGEDNLLGEATEMVMTPQEAQSRLSELTGQGTPYWDKFHPEHRQYVDEALRLREYL